MRRSRKWPDRSRAFSGLVTKLYIVGTGGLAKEAGQLARQADPHGHRWHAIGYVAASGEAVGPRLYHGAVEHTDNDFFDLMEPCDVLIAVGHPAPRRRLAMLALRNPAFRFPNLVHPAVDIDKALVSLGRGNMICKGVVITCDITIGDFNLFNWNVTVGHDTAIGSWNVINPGSNISGATRVGDACLLGTGSQVLERLKIASEVVVGAGSVVTRSISQPGVYVGIPARRRA